MELREVLILAVTAVLFKTAVAQSGSDCEVFNISSGVPKPSEKCGKNIDPSQVGVGNQAVKNKIQKFHDTVREAAEPGKSGTMTNVTQPRFKKLEKLQWNDTIANRAQAWTNRCENRKLNCSANDPGQNFKDKVVEPRTNIEQAVEDIFNDWIEEVKNCKALNISNITQEAIDQCGSIIQILSGRARQYGCGMIRREDEATKKDKVHLVCQYEPNGVVIGQPLFETEDSPDDEISEIINNLIKVITDGFFYLLLTIRKFFCPSDTDEKPYKPKYEKGYNKMNVYNDYNNPNTYNTRDQGNMHNSYNKPNAHDTRDERNRYNGYNNPNTYNTRDQGNMHNSYNKPNAHDTRDERNRYNGYNNPNRYNNYDGGNMVNSYNNPNVYNTRDQRNMYNGYNNPDTYNTNGRRNVYSGYNEPNIYNTHGRRNNYNAYNGPHMNNGPSMNKNNNPNPYKIYTYNPYKQK